MTIKKTVPSFDDAGLPLPRARSTLTSHDDRFAEMESLLRRLDELYPQASRARRPATEFAHLTNPDELALELYCSSHLLDLNCPEIQRLIESTVGSVQGAFLAEKLRPNTYIGKPKPKRRKRPLKGKTIIFPNLISFQNELARIHAAREA